jgi:hypothetical protein
MGSRTEVTKGTEDTEPGQTRSEITEKDVARLRKYQRALARLKSRHYLLNEIV